MKRFFGVILVCLVVLFATWAFSPLKHTSSVGYSQTIKPELILNQITLKHPQEKDGDELYLTLSARVAKKPTEYFRIPEKPMHWLSRQIGLVKDVNLWSDSIADGQSVTLIIELNEQDALPLNPDDLLGIVRVKLKNEKGVLQFNWDIPNSPAAHFPEKRSGELITPIKEPGSIERFDFESDGAKYEVYLSLKTG